MILANYEKQPDERKDYDVDYAEWLSDIVDTLDLVEPSVTCLSDPLDTSLVVEPDPPMTTTQVKLWVNGGTDGMKYKITLKTTTVGGRIDESELIFKVRDR